MKKKLVISFLMIFCHMTGYNQQLETVIQQGHTSSVLCADFSPDGKLLVTGSDDRTIKLWEKSSGKEVRTFSGHASSVLDVKYSPLGDYFASASQDRTIKLWDPMTGKLLQTLEKHESAVSSIDISADGKTLVSVSADKMGYIWDIGTGQVIRDFRVRAGQYGAKVSLSSDGRYIALGNDDGESLILNLESLDTVRRVRELRFSSCGGCYSEVSISDNMKFFLTAADKGPLILWDFESGEKIRTLLEELKDYNAIGFANKGQLIYASDRRSIYIWDTKTGDTLQTITGHSKDINQVITVRDRPELLSTGDDNIAILWDMRSGRSLNRFAGALSMPEDNGLDLDPDDYWQSYAFQIIQLKNRFELMLDDNFLLKSNLGKNLTIWDWKKGARVRELRGHEKAVTCFDISADGRYLVTGSGDRKAILWDAMTGDSLRAFIGHRYIILDVEISHNGKFLATAGYDGYAKVWEIETGRELQSIRLSQDMQKIDNPFVLAFSPNDLYLLTGSTGQVFTMWEIYTGNPYMTFTGHSRVVADMEFTNDQKRLLTCSWDNTIRLWDYRTGYQERKYEAHTEPVNDVTILSKSNRFVSGSTDRTAILWDLESGEVIKKFEGHASAITSVNVTKDEKYLLAGAIDGTIKVWDLLSGEVLITHHFIGERDWMVKNSAGYFHATPEMKQYVHFVNGFETYDIDQFFEEFYMPDIMERTFSSSRAIEGSILDQLQKSPPPDIEITFPESGQTFNRESIDVLVKVTNTGGGIDEVKLLHNGKRIAEEIYALDRPQKEGKSIYQTYSIKLIPGQNTFRASAFSKERIESRAAESMVVLEGAGNPANCYVLAVGINKYQNSRLNLNFARADAENFSEVLRTSQGDLFDKVEVYTLYDREATRVKILEYLDFIARQADPSDVFFFYYAGHGSMVDDDFYFIPTECVRLYEQEALEQEALYAGLIQEKFKMIQALKQVVIVDACQSGGSAELLAQRGAANEKAIAQLSRSAGVHVLASAGSEQYASEFEQLGHGIFTYVLLEALEGKADGAPLDGKVTIFELKSYLDTMVPELSEKYKGKSQYPYTFSRGHDFPLFIKPVDD